MFTRPGFTKNVDHRFQIFKGPWRQSAGLCQVPQYQRIDSAKVGVRQQTAQRHGSEITGYRPKTRFGHARLNRIALAACPCRWS